MIGHTNKQRLLLLYSSIIIHFLNNKKDKQLDNPQIKTDNEESSLFPKKMI